MKKLSNTEAELKKGVAYKKSVYMTVFGNEPSYFCIFLKRQKRFFLKK